MNFLCDSRLLILKKKTPTLKNTKLRRRRNYFTTECLTGQTGKTAVVVPVSLSATN